MVGSAIVRELVKKGYQNIVTRTHSELDLTSQLAVQSFFDQERPDQVYLAAAKVGGIHANNTFPAEFIYQNLMIESNVIHNAFTHGTKKLLFLGSSCIYPKLAPQPMSEDVLLTGKLEPTNEPYAIAKIAGIKLCESYNRQYGKSHGIDYRSVMPTNLYGPGDNYHLENSHVIPALIRRLHDGKIKKLTEIAIWGTGEPRREFLYSDDMASASVFVMELDRRVYDQNTESMQSQINIGSGLDISIAELGQEISDAIGYKGRIVYDHSKMDGAPRKQLNCELLNRLGWHASTELRKGIALTYKDFLENYKCT